MFLENETIYNIMELTFCSKMPLTTFRYCCRWIIL